MADNPLNQSFPIDLELISNPETLSPKLIMPGEEYTGQPYISVTEDDISLVADLDTVISLSSELGINIQGPISIAAMPDQVSFCGYWRIHPLNLTAIGSSAALPIPWLEKSTPRSLQSNGVLGTIAGDLESSLGL